MEKKINELLARCEEISARNAAEPGINMDKLRELIIEVAKYETKDVLQQIE